MKRERYLRRRMQTLCTLGDAVSAMKSLSAHHFRRCRQGLTAARAYRVEIEDAIAEVGVWQQGEVVAPPGLLLIVSDLGLCGSYNVELVSVALAEHARTPGPLYAVGRRPRAQLSSAGIQPRRAYDAPTSFEGLPGLLLQLAQDLLDDVAVGAIGNLNVVSARFEGAGQFKAVLTPVLPVRPPREVRPLNRTRYEDQTHLVAVAVREFLYTILHELLLDALASEHSMRLVAAESARQWLDDTTAAVRRELGAVRRETTTQEVLDVVAGARLRRRTRAAEAG